MTDSRIVTDNRGREARINLAFAGCYALALPGIRGAITGTTVQEVRDQAAKHGFT